MKIKKKNIQKIIERCTANEINLIIHIAQYQNDYGIICGISRQNICESINISRSYFYDILHGLEKKDIISINYNNDDFAMWEIRIIDNIFATDEDWRADGGYLNINNDFLHSTEFLKLTKGEKVIILNLLCLYRENRNNIPISMKTLLSWTGSSLSSIYRYLISLIKHKNIIMFSRVRSNGGMIIIFNANSKLFYSGSKNEGNTYYRHYLSYLLKKNNCTAKEQDIKDSIVLIKQYIKRFSFNRIIQYINYCIESKSTLQPKYINYMISRNLEINI